MKFKYGITNLKWTGNEVKYVTDAIKSTWVGWEGDYVKRFEKEFAKWVGTKYAVTTTSGTSALTLAVAALGIGEGDEVIVPEFTMMSCAFAVTYNKAKPVFVDCGEDLNIDVKKIEEKITPKTRAIMAVHIYGRMCDMKAIRKLAKYYGLYVIEDACEAYGGTIDGIKAGNWGDVGIFSMYVNKVMTAGEGGIVTTNNERIYEQLKYLRHMAFDDEHTYLHRKVGFNFRMTNLQAALVLAQLEQVDKFIEKRKEIAKWYDEDLERFTIPRPEGSVIWYYDIILPYEENIDLYEALKKKGIETRIFFKPMSLQPIYFNPEVYQTKAYEFSKKGLYLPTYPQLTYKDVKYISKEVLSTINEL